MADNHQQSGGTYVRIGLESSTIAIVISLMLIIGVCGVVIGQNTAERARNALELARSDARAEAAEKQAQLLQYYLLELDAKFIGAGLKKPEESIAKKLGEHK